MRICRCLLCVVCGLCLWPFQFQRVSRFCFCFCFSDSEITDVSCVHLVHVWWLLGDVCVFAYVMRVRMTSRIREAGAGEGGNFYH